MTKLYRSSTDKKLGGICGGLSEIYDIDPTIVRLGVIFLGFVTAFLPIIITYIVGWAIIPEGKPLNDKVKDPPPAQ